MANLTFLTGTMDSGKSTLALQTHYVRGTRGRHGLVFTTHDRAGDTTVSSRLGLSSPATAMRPDLDVTEHIRARMAAGERIDYLVCDEAQFYTPAQIEQLANLVDHDGIDVLCFGLVTDFRTELFPGSKRLLELADIVVPAPVPTLCWCGDAGTHQARLVNGRMVTQGAQVVIGDTVGEAETPTIVGYEVLCRKHHMMQMPHNRALEAGLA